MCKCVLSIGLWRTRNVAQSYFAFMLRATGHVTGVNGALEMTFMNYELVCMIAYTVNQAAFDFS